MLFWIICCVLACVVAVIIITPLVRPPSQGAPDPQVALYKAQLREVDRDIARDVIAPEDAERVKTEIARRLIAASGRTSVTTDRPIRRGFAIAAAAVMVAVAGGLYWQIGAPGYPDLPLKTRIAHGDEMRANRPSQDVAETTAPILDPPAFPADYIASVEKLRELVPLRPNDQRGWELLAYHESQMRNYAAAARAQGQVVAIKADTATIDDLTMLADLLAAAADGYVSPQTEIIARRILELDPENIAGRYYMGAMYDQTDRPDFALRFWRSILDRGATETFHLALARRFVGDAAIRAGTDYTPPPATQAALEDVIGNETLTQEDQAEMIAGMVNGLADRLATQGGPVDQWARLIVAYGVLGQMDDARDILAEARDVFGASDDAVALLDEAAARAGITP